MTPATINDKPETDTVIVIGCRFAVVAGTINRISGHFEGENAGLVGFCCHKKVSGSGNRPQTRNKQSDLKTTRMSSGVGVPSQCPP